MRAYRTRRRKRRGTGPGRASTFGIGGGGEERRAGGHPRGDLVDRNGARSTGDCTWGSWGGRGTDGARARAGTGAGAGGRARGGAGGILPLS